MENTSLRKLANGLDSKLCSMGLSVSTLEDIKVLLGHLVEDMEKAVHLGEERAYYSEHFRTVRVLWNLARYTVDDLCNDFENVESIKGQLFEMVVPKKENRSAGNTTASLQM